jgi:hypothetical protein
MVGVSIIDSFLAKRGFKPSQLYLFLRYNTPPYFEILKEDIAELSRPTSLSISIKNLLDETVGIRLHNPAFLSRAMKAGNCNYQFMTNLKLSTISTHSRLHTTLPRPKLPNTEKQTLERPSKRAA